MSFDFYALTPVQICLSCLFLSLSEMAALNFFSHSGSNHEAQPMHKPQPLLNVGPRDDYVFCSSRGSSRNDDQNPISILHHLSNNMSNYYYPINQNRLIFNIRPGSKIDQIAHDIIQRHRSRGSPPNCHAYVIGGYCDITDREKIYNYRIKNSATGLDRVVRYEEVTFMRYTIQQAYIAAIHRYAHAARLLKADGLRPSFATIPPSCLAKWNDYRLYHGNTALLIHEHQYADMQEAMNVAIAKINGFICKLNTLNGMDTPYLAGTVLKTFAAKGRGPILQRHKLYDGVHADDLLIEEWAKKIQTAIENSRSRPDDIMPGLHHHTPYHLALILEGIKLY